MAKRPYDDIETDYLEEENESGFLSLVSVVIAFIAVAVFIALAWYAYQSSTKTDSGEDIQVVYPEDGPVREAPEETGGWQFPHQDKSVYNIVSGEEGGEGEATVEQILPAPEQPVKRPETETATWMNKELKQDTIAKTDAERLKEEKTQAESVAAETSTEVEAQPVAEAAEATEVSAQEKANDEAAAAAIAAERAAMIEAEKIAAAAKVTEVAKVEEAEKAQLAAQKAAMAAEAAAAEAQKVAESATNVGAVPVATTTTTVKEEIKPVEDTKTEPVKAPVKVETKAVPKPQIAASPAAATGSARLQLGAVKSDADARAQWQKMQAKHGALAGKKLNVEAVTLPGKGTLYRIQAVGFANRSAAQTACGQISAAGQACFAVGK